MSTPILLAAAACADWLVTFKPLAAIAKYFEIEPSSLQIALAQVHEHTYRGKLTAALVIPHDRPDLLFHKTLLARLEHQLAINCQQFDRADTRVGYLESLECDCNDRQFVEAQKFANRVHQQQIRLIKDIQKAHKELEKAINKPSETATASVENLSTPSQSRPASPPAQVLQSPSPSPSSDDAAAQTLEIANSNAPTSTSTSATGPTTEPSISPPPVSPPPTEEELLTCIARHRHRIKSTPAPQRQALMARLIEEHRAKTNHRAA